MQAVSWPIRHLGPPKWSETGKINEPGTRGICPGLDRSPTRTRRVISGATAQILPPIRAWLGKRAKTPVPVRELNRNYNKWSRTGAEAGLLGGWRLETNPPVVGLWSNLAIWKVASRYGRSSLE